MEMCITGYGVMDNLSSQHMEKQSTAFPHPANLSYPQPHKQPVIRHSYNACYGGIPLIPIYLKKIFFTPVNHL